MCRMHHHQSYNVEIPTKTGALSESVARTVASCYTVATHHFYHVIFTRNRVQCSYETSTTSSTSHIIYCEINLC